MSLQDTCVDLGFGKILTALSNSGIKTVAWHYDLRESRIDLADGTVLKIHPSQDRDGVALPLLFDNWRNQYSRLYDDPSYQETSGETAALFDLERKIAEATATSAADLAVKILVLDANGEISGLGDEYAALVDCAKALVDWDLTTARTVR